MEWINLPNEDEKSIETLANCVIHICGTVTGGTCGFKFCVTRYCVIDH